MVDDIKATVAFDDTSSSSSSSDDPNPMARIRSIIFAVKSTNSIGLKKDEESKPLMLKPSHRCAPASCHSRFRTDADSR